MSVNKSRVENYGKDENDVKNMLCFKTLDNVFLDIGFSAAIIE
jgi:hypothetical protein